MHTQNQSWLFTFILFLIIPVIGLAQSVNPEDSTGLPGDHFSLEGALDLFKKAASPEDFEKRLNTESNYVNNLDLNEDGEIDYIRVIDHRDGDLHAIVLQVPVSAEESQDVAVIEIEKQGPEEAILQIVGDEDLYGESRIVEPFEEEVQRGGRGPSADMKIYRLVVNVWAWPTVRFVYRPSYVVWVSPFRWGYYPNWWRPWRPRPWRAFSVRHVHYRTSYHVVRTHRVVRAHKIYTPRRKSSTIVRTRTTTRVAAQGRNGQVKAAKKTTTTKATVRNGNRRAAASRTTTRTGVRTNRGTATRKTTTTRAAKAGKGGRAVGRKKTTKVRRKKNG